MSLRLRPPKHLSPRLSTPALDGLTMHETLYGSLARRVSLRNLLIVALVMIVGYQSVALSFYASKTRYLPVFVLHDSDGNYHVLSEPDPNWSPSDMLARADVRDLIYAMRGVLMDPTENTRRWEKVLRRTTEQGGKHAEAAYWELKEKLKTFKGLIQVDIQTILTRQPLQTYEVLWTETRWDENKDRVPQGVSRWRGIISLKFHPAFANPDSAPDGILYDAWSISEER